MLEKYFETRKAFETEETKIQNRIDEIIKEIFDHLILRNYIKQDWTINQVDSSFISFYRPGDWNPFRLLETNEIDYNYRIPTSFLSMKDRDIFLEIDKNIGETHVKKLEKENTRKSVLNKLTKEEKEIIGIY
jgi:hypothetical protein